MPNREAQGQTLVFASITANPSSRTGSRGSKTTTLPVSSLSGSLGHPVAKHRFRNFGGVGNFFFCFAFFLHRAPQAKAFERSSAFFASAFFASANLSAATMFLSAPLLAIDFSPISKMRSAFSTYDAQASISFFRSARFFPFFFCLFVSL